MPKPASHRGEFGIIEKYLSPLSRSMPGAFSLADDAALLSCRSGYELVLTKDAMVSGVHFLEQDKPSDIARKLLRTNLSDLAGMGAKPVGYLLSTAWPEGCDEAFVKDFAKGLEGDQSLFGVGLLGGDTVRTPGPLSLSLTAIGEVPAGKALRRNGAKQGDLLYVSGTLGDSAFGLAALTGQIKDLPDPDKVFLEQRYHLPEPRLSLGYLLRDYASACLDISDGLLADVGHISRQSGVSVVIERDKVPLSPAARSLVNRDEEHWQRVVGGGDDYELAFTIPLENTAALQSKIEYKNLNISHIGYVEAGEGVRLLDGKGQEIKGMCGGWTHF